MHTGWIRIGARVGFYKLSMFLRHHVYFMRFADPQ